MVQSRRYGAPGVYKEDVYVPPAEVGATGVPAFLGLAQGGAVGVAQRYGLWNEFVREHAMPGQNAYLGYAVRNFFANGGRECYVIRLPELSESTLEAGLQKLERVDEVDLVCVPDIATRTDGFTNPAEVIRLQSMVTMHCARLGDRFAILDAHPQADMDRHIVEGQRDALQDGEGYSAIYYPWILVPRADSFADGTHVRIPPCGGTAGVYARVGHEAGVHVAPANEVLEEAVDVGANLSRSDQADLNPDGSVAINCVRAFPGRGIRVWGARTLCADPQWRYVHVRRLYVAMVRWIERNMADVVFEPNDARLWARVVRELKSYMIELYRHGAFKGATPAEAFFIKCDAETNPEEVRERGWVVTEVGFAPTTPGEFIVVRLHQTGGELIVSSVPPVPGRVASGTAAPTNFGAVRAGGDVRISYIEYSTPGRDLSGEYVQIRNWGRNRINLGNCSLSDEAGHVFRFPGFILRPYGAVRIWTKRGADTATDLHWGRSAAVWNNIGDVATLRDKAGLVVHVYRYVT